MRREAAGDENNFPEHHAVRHDEPFDFHKHMERAAEARHNYELDVQRGNSLARHVELSRYYSWTHLLNNLMRKLKGNRVAYKSLFGPVNKPQVEVGLSPQSNLSK